MMMMVVLLLLLRLFLQYNKKKEIRNEELRMYLPALMISAFAGGCSGAPFMLLGTLSNTQERSKITINYKGK